MSRESARDELRSLFENGYVISNYLVSDVYEQNGVDATAGRKDFENSLKNNELGVDVDFTTVKGSKTQIFYAKQLSYQDEVITLGEENLSDWTDIEQVRQEIRRLMYLEAPDPKLLEKLVIPHSWEEQVNNLIHLNFHSMLGMEEQEYRTSLPQLQTRPKKFSGRFDLPLLVDSRVDIKTQLQLSGIKKSDFSDFPNQTDQTPYLLWVQNGRSHLKTSVDQFNKERQSDERGLTVIEGLALIREYPNIIGSHQLILTESVTSSYSHIGKIGRSYNELKLESIIRTDKTHYSHGIPSAGI